jgi:hypothetical protein
MDARARLAGLCWRRSAALDDADGPSIRLDRPYCGDAANLTIVTPSNGPSGLRVASRSAAKCSLVGRDKRGLSRVRKFRWATAGRATFLVALEGLLGSCLGTGIRLASPPSLRSRAFPSSSRRQDGTSAIDPLRAFESGPLRAVNPVKLP